MTTKSVSFLPVTDATAECVAKGTTTEVRLPCRYVSLVQPSVRAPSYTPAHDEEMRAAFVGDVVRATSAAVVDELVSWLATVGGTRPGIASCETQDVADLECQRLFDELLSVADSVAHPTSDPPQLSSDAAELGPAALRYAAAVLRAKAVRW